MCGSKRVRRKQVTVQLGNGQTVRGIEAEVCLVCGERYYDLEAMRKLDEAKGR